MILLLKDLTIESCEKAFFGINDIEVDIVCDTRVLSKISDDYLAANECIREYLKRYFKAKKKPNSLTQKSKSAFQAFNYSHDDSKELYALA